MPEQITVVGAGFMGHGIAQVFAVQGHDVKVYDSSAEILETVRPRVAGNLEKLAEFGLVDSSATNDILSRIRVVSDLMEACKGSDLVIEAVVENLELKREIFKKLDEICPETTVLCSNTSVISITEIAESALYKHRIVGTHWWNPPYLVPLVEVIRAENTSTESMKRVYGLLKSVGKQPVFVNKDIPGFIGNRLQHALWREAFSLVDAGVCNAETIDTVVRNSFGLRLPVLGPMENADSVGLDLILSIHDYIFPHLTNTTTAATTLSDRVKAGHLGAKTGKGLFEWSQEKMTQRKSDLDTHLMRLLSERSKVDHNSSLRR